MHLLEEIQQAAADASIDLATLLRKCKILSARLGSRPLEEWVAHESGGYPAAARVPEYRKWPLQVRGHFMGSFQSALRFAPVPAATLPVKVRDAYDNYECRLSVASIEVTLKDADGMVQLGTNDLAVALGMNVYQGMNCIQAWAEFSPSMFVELLNAVRNRILDFSLALWKESPEAGSQGIAGGDRLGAEHITQIFNMTISGGTTQLVGSAIGSSVSFTVVRGSFDSLARTFESHGIAPEDIVALETAVESEPPGTRPALGPRVTQWMSGMLQKAASGSWQVSLGAAGNILGDAIAKFYGI